MVIRAKVNGKNMVYVGWIDEDIFEGKTDHTPTIKELVKEDLKEELYN